MGGELAGAGKSGNCLLNCEIWVIQSIRFVIPVQNKAKPNQGSMGCEQQTCCGAAGRHHAGRFQGLGQLPGITWRSGKLLEPALGRDSFCHSFLFGTSPALRQQLKRLRADNPCSAHQILGARADSGSRLSSSFNEARHSTRHGTQDSFSRSHGHFGRLHRCRKCCGRARYRQGVQKSSLKGKEQHSSCFVLRASTLCKIFKGSAAHRSCGNAVPMTR